MVAKTAGKSTKKSPQISPQKSPQKGTSAENQAVTEEEVEQIPSGKDIMEAIMSSEILTSKIDALAVDVNLMRHEFDKIHQRTSEIEIRVSKVEDKLKADNREWHILKRYIRMLQDRAIDSERCLRRNNVRIVGLPECAEGDNPIKFSEKLLTEVLDLVDISTMFVVERARRISFRSPKPGAPPYPF